MENFIFCAVTCDINFPQDSEPYSEHCQTAKMEHYAKMLTAESR